MQQSKIIVQARPPQSRHVVPLEPSLHSRFVNMLITAILLMLYIIGTAFYWTHPIYTPIWNDSYANTLLVYSLTQIAILCIVPSWKELDRRRQQAARYNFAVRPQMHTTSSNLADLPVNFMIQLRRRRSVTYILGLLFALFFIIMGVLLDSTWQTIMQAVQHAGASMAPALLLTGVNLLITLLCVLVMIGLLFYAPRQKLIATPGGLFCQRIFRSSYIPWQEARLFAVIAQTKQRKRNPGLYHGSTLYYELSSKDTVIRWPSQPHGGSVMDTPAGIAMSPRLLAEPTSSVETFQREVQLLNIIVNERSGLPLYDLR